MSPKSFRLVVGLLFTFAALASTAEASTLTVDDTGSPQYSSIQAAIAAANPGDTIAVGAGTYDENLAVDKALTIQGAGAGSTIVRPAVSNPNCGGLGGGSLCAGASNMVLVQASSVTIEDLTLDGDNPALSSGIIRAGADVDARNGIITDNTVGTVGNLVVSHTAVKNIYLRGIYPNTTGGTFTIDHNTVDNVQGETASIAIFEWLGNGTISNNTVTRANDAISGNHSMGTQFLDNVVSQSGSGVHTDNAGDSGGVADTISGNTISNCTTNGYGVWVFVAYIAPVVTGNTVSGCNVGLANFAPQAGITTTFSDNDVDGTGGGAQGAGLFVSTDSYGYGNFANTTVATGNTIRNFDSGIATEEKMLTDAVVNAHSNRIVGNLSGIDAGVGTVVNAENNWWGCNAGPGTAGCDSTTGPVSADPWLTLTAGPSVGEVTPGSPVSLWASLRTNSDHATVPTSLPDIAVTFSQASGPAAAGLPSSKTLVNGLAQTTITPVAGTASLRATVDGQASTAFDVVGTANAPTDVTTTTADPGDTVTQGDAGTDPVATDVEVPAAGGGGVVTIAVKDVDDAAPAVVPNTGTYAVLGEGLQITAPPQSVADPLVFTFTVDNPAIPDNQVLVFRNGSPVADCTGAGATPDPCVAGRVRDGNNDLVITVRTTHASFWTIGALAPHVIVDSGPSNGGYSTTSPTTQFTFHAEDFANNPFPGAAFECDVDGGAGAVCTSPYAPALAEGPHTVQIQANDGFVAGPIETISFTVDSKKPVPAFTTKPALKSNVANPTFTWTGGDPSPSSGYQATHCTLDGSGATQGVDALCSAFNGGGSIAFSPGEGSHTFVVTVTDNAGNTDTVSWTWEVDLIDPDTIIDAPKPGISGAPGTFVAADFVTADGSPTLTYHSTDAPYTAGHNTKFQCELTGTTNGAPVNTGWVACNGGSKPYANLQQGSYTFRVRAIDDAGNVDSTPDTWSWKIDRRPPVQTAQSFPYGGARFSYYKPIRADYACAEPLPDVLAGLSGLATCAGTVPIGSDIPVGAAPPPTDTAGIAFPWALSTSDNVGNVSNYALGYKVFTFAGLIRDDQPIAYYRMDDPEGSPTLKDVSGNNHDGEYKNGTQSGPEGISGDGNTARVFSGRDGYGFVNGIHAPTTKYTMAAFVKFDDSSDGMIMQHGGGGALLRKGNQLIFHQVDTDVALTVPGGIQVGCWYFVAGTFDGFSATVYAGSHDDGALDCTPGTTGREYFTPVSAPSSKWPSGTATFYVGYGDQAPWLKGSLDEVAYFDHVISPTHLNEIWLADPPPARGGAKTTPTFTQNSGNSGDSANPLKPVSAAAAKARARAKVKAASEALAQAQARVRVLKKHHASRRAIAKAQKSVRLRVRALTRARRALALI